jgi:hypothetical protein
MRFSFRTLTIAMLLGGPLCAWAWLEWDSMDRYTQQFTATTMVVCAFGLAYLIAITKLSKWLTGRLSQPDVVEPTMPPLDPIKLRTKARTAVWLYQNYDRLGSISFAMAQWRYYVRLPLVAVLLAVLSGWLVSPTFGGIIAAFGVGWFVSSIAYGWRIGREWRYSAALMDWVAVDRLAYDEDVSNSTASSPPEPASSSPAS